MVSHQPPYDTINDQVSPGVHVGSNSIRKFIEEHQPLVCFSGHIHEGTGIDHIGNTAIVNPGSGRQGKLCTDRNIGRADKKTGSGATFPGINPSIFQVIGIRSARLHDCMT